MTLPEGYRPTVRQPPFWELTGPFYEKECDGSRHPHEPRAENSFHLPSPPKNARPKAAHPMRSI